MNTNDLVVGLDPTGYTNITGAQLAQMVNSATPSSDRGFILVSTDANDGTPNVPNASATGTVAWQKYIWLRLSATFVTAYVWNPNGATNATLLNWITISQAAIAPGSILNSQLAGGITYDKITSVSSSAIQGSVVAGWLAGLNPGLTGIVADGLVTTALFSNPNLVWGDLAGSNTTNPGLPVVKPLAITQAKLALQSVAGNVNLFSVLPTSAGQIVDNSIRTQQLFSSNPTTGLYDVVNTRGITNLPPQTLNAVDPLCDISVPKNSGIGQNYTPSAIAAGGTTGQAVAAGDILVVNTAKTGFVTANRTILNLAEPVATTDDNKFVTVNAGGTGYQLTSVATFGKLLQTVSARSTVSSYLAGGATATQIIQTALPQFSFNGTSVSPVSTKTGFVLDGVTSGSTKIPLALSFTPLSSTSVLKITLSIPLITSNNSPVQAAVYSLNPANAAVTSGAIAYSGGSGTSLNPIVDTIGGYAVSTKYVYYNSTIYPVMDFEWILTPKYAYGTTAYAAGTAMTIVACVGATTADALGINSTSTSAANAIFATGALASTFTVQEITL